jgi:hypothetical protein
MGEACRMKIAEMRLVTVGKPECKIPLGRPRCSGVDNTTMCHGVII